MNREAVQSILDARALHAVLPLLAVVAGIVCLLIAEMFARLRPARGIIVLGSLGAAFGLLGAQLRQADSLGLVLSGSFAATRTSAAWGLLFVAATAISWSFARKHYSAHERGFLAEHDALMLTSCLGMMLMAGAQNLIAFFIGLELLSIPLYALCGFRRTRDEAVEAGLKYFLLGAFASAIFLYGAALLYAGSGSIQFDELRATGIAGTLPIAGVALIAVSLLFKIGAFPFHLWVPDVYQGSATPVTAFMATTTKAAALAFLVQAAFLLPASAAGLLAAIAVITMAVGNLAALVQTNLKRLLAYSSVAHGGTMLLAVASGLAGDPLPGGAVQAVLYYAAAYVFTTGGAFAILALLEQDGETFGDLASLRGLAARRPVACAALVLFLLSLGGIPLTGGFLGKYFVFASAVRAQMYGAAIVGVLLSVVALGYYLRVIVAMYMEERPAGLPEPRPVDASIAIPGALCAALVVLLGVAPGWFLGRVF